MYSRITGIGVYQPEIIKANGEFHEVNFLKQDHSGFSKTAVEIVTKFEEITEIKERRVAKSDVVSSQMGYLAAVQAIANAGIDKESIDYIMVAHNFGDVHTHHKYYDMVPNLAARIKGKLGIKNLDCVAYDVLFGCPGWLECLKQAHLYIQCGEAERVLVVGTETVSRVADNHDIDSMLFSDGAGAVILEKTEEAVGILAHKSVSSCGEELEYLKMGPSYDKEQENDGLYLKMNGKKVYRYAMENIPKVVDVCLKKANLELKDIKYLVMHQANGKMIKMLAQKLHEAHGIAEWEEEVLPMNVGTMGNNSVATIPTLLYELMSGQMNGREINPGDIIAFASVGAGMHANCVIHQF